MASNDALKVTLELAPWARAFVTSTASEVRERLARGETVDVEFVIGSIATIATMGLRVQRG
jgi:hypothetical protein